MSFSNWSILIALSVSIAPQTVQAEDWPPFSAEMAASDQYKKCITKEVGTAQETNCLIAESKRQDALLSVAFQESLTNSPVAMRKQQIKAQNAWIAFRNENCKTRAMNPGSGMPVFYEGCIVRETITRIREIEEAWDY